MTVSQVLAAHASAQMQAAQASDEARRAGEQSGASVAKQPGPSFVESWGCRSTVIGVSRQARA